MPHSSYLRDDIRARSFDREHGFLLGSLEDVWAGHATHASVVARSAQRASVCLMGTLYFYIVFCAHWSIVHLAEYSHIEPTFEFARVKIFSANQACASRLFSASRLALCPMRPFSLKNQHTVYFDLKYSLTRTNRKP